MRAVDLILKKRRGFSLTEDEIRFLIRGYVDGLLPEYQLSAWLMAVSFRGMTPEETGFLTQEMIDSGAVMDLSALPGPRVGRYSTGGTGDKVSLILAPLAAACGLEVPLMMERGLEKLKAIPGYSVFLDPYRFQDVLRTAGYGMIERRSDVTPAGRLIQSLTEVTGTADTVPLISARILSGHIAGGAESLVCEIKCGKGGFFREREPSGALAASLVATGRSLGRRVVAVVTACDEPLGNMVGNFLEVEEAVQCLQGQGPDDLMEVVFRLTAWMLVAGGRASSVEEALIRCHEALVNGSALDKFRQNVQFQGGDYETLMEGLGVCRSRHMISLTAEKDGIITGIDALTASRAAVILGAGRRLATDIVSPYVGMEFFHKTGSVVRTDETVCTIYAEEEGRMRQALEMMKTAVTIEGRRERSGDAPAMPSLILEELSGL